MSKLPEVMQGVATGQAFHRRANGTMKRPNPGVLLVSQIIFIHVQTTTLARHFVCLGDGPLR